MVPTKLSFPQPLLSVCASLWVVSCSGQAQSYYVYKGSSIGGYLEPQTTSNSCGVSALASLPKALHVNSNSSEKKCYVSGELTFD